MKKGRLFKTMLLLCALIVGSSSARGQITATITFANQTSGTSDSSTELTTSTFVSSGIANSSTAFGTITCSATGKCYKGKVGFGLKAGGSSAAGSFTLAFSSALTNVTKITLNRASYSDSKTATITVKNGATTLANAVSTPSSSAEFADMDITNLNIASLSGLTVETSRYCYIKSITITYTSSDSNTPSITANDVNIEYNATNGSIGYSLQNANGNVSASVTSGDWLTLEAITASAVPFTCSANTGATARTATVSLSYTGASNKVVTITQAADPNAFHNISDITAASTDYKVKGTVVATNARGLVIGDGTGYVYYYKGDAVTQSVDNIISISGTTSSYGHVLQLPNTATIAATTTSNYNNTPAVAIVDATAMAAYNSGLHLSDYVQFQGILAKSGSYYNITVGTATASISYPTGEQQTALDALVNKTVCVKGYFTGYSGSNFSVMLKSVEEVPVPTITATPASLTGLFYGHGNGPGDAKTFSVSGINLTANITLSLGASSDFEMSLTEGSGYTNELSLTPTTGIVETTTIYVRLKAGLDVNNYNGTITISSTDAENKSVSLSGKVADFASLPFSWKGTSSAGSSDLAAKTNTIVNLGSDFAASNAPYRLKFDGNGKYVTIYTNEKPEAVSFTAKIFSAASTGSRIKVQGSADGITFTDVQEFTISGAANATFVFTTTEAFAANHRAVKLVMSNKDQNVGVGSILITSNSYAAVAVTAAGWASFSSAAALDFTGTGVTAYIAKAKDDTHVTLAEITKVPANTGIVVSADAGSYAIPLLSGDADETTGNLLKPWLTAGTPTEETYYTLAAGPSFKLSTGGVLAAGKAYLVLSGSSAPQLSVDFGEGTTGIDEVRTLMEEVREGIFDLSGRRVEKPTKGIYIVNGKKIIVK